VLPHINQAVAAAAIEVQ